jgi:hypothetical protein
MTDLLESENIRVMLFTRSSGFLTTFNYYIYELLHYRKIEHVNSMERGKNPLSHMCS